jgi:hypothetical protein
MALAYGTAVTNAHDLSLGVKELCVVMSRLILLKDLAEILNYLYDGRCPGKR